MSSFLPEDSKLAMTSADTLSTWAKSDISNFTMLTLSGKRHLDLTLSSSLTFLAEMMTSASFRLNSYVRYYPIPEEAPVIHTVLSLKFGLTYFLRA